MNEDKFISHNSGLLLLGLWLFSILGGAFLIGIIFPSQCGSGNCYTSQFFPLLGIGCLIGLCIIIYWHTYNGDGEKVE